MIIGIRFDTPSGVFLKCKLKYETIKQWTVLRRCTEW